MSNAPYDRAALALAALEYVPPLIRNHLLADPEFTQEYDLRTEALLNVGVSDVLLRRTELLMLYGRFSHAPLNGKSQTKMGKFGH